MWNSVNVYRVACGHLCWRPCLWRCRGSALAVDGHAAPLLKLFLADPELLEGLQGGQGFQPLWVHRFEYEEHGPFFLYRRCFWTAMRMATALAARTLGGVSALPHTGVELVLIPVALNTPHMPLLSVFLYFLTSWEQLHTCGICLKIYIS